MLSRVLGLLLLGVLAWFMIMELAPQRPPLGPLRQSLAAEAALAMVKDIHARRGDARTAVVLPFEGDSSGRLTAQVRELLQLRGVLLLPPPPLSERISDLFNLPLQGQFNDALAARAAQNAGMDLAIIARVERLESGPERQGVVDVRYRLVSAGGHVVHDGRYRKQVKAAPVMPAMPAALQAGWETLLYRGLAWGLMMLLLPVVSVSFIRTMLRRNSNTANAVMLAVYALAGGISAHLLFSPLMDGGWLALTVLGASAIAFAYTVYLASTIINMEKRG